MKSTTLHCLNCTESFPSTKSHSICPVCGGVLDVDQITKAKIHLPSSLSESAIYRYQNFFPYLDIDSQTTLGEGLTPLVFSDKLSRRYGVKGIFFKNETQNPTWSFKDRGTLTGILHAIQSGYKRIGTVSTGNMAVSVAAYGSKFGLDTYILVNSNIAEEKLNPIAIYNPHLIKVQGDYGDLYRKSLEVGYENEIYFINSDAPFRVEGYKTLAYEVCEQLNFDVPDYIIVPTSAGGNIRGILKGFEEFKASGYIDKLPVFVCAQAAGCAPIIEAAQTDSMSIHRFENPNTIAHAIENPLPPSGNAVLSLLRKNKGHFLAVSDDEIIKAQAELSRQGLFVQPASAVSLAAIDKLKQLGLLKPSDTIVSVLTGSGLKYTSAFEKHSLSCHECTSKELASYIKKLIPEDL